MGAGLQRAMASVKKDNDAVKAAKKAAKNAKKSLEKDDDTPASVAPTVATPEHTYNSGGDNDAPAYRLDVEVPENPIAGTARVWRAVAIMLEQWRSNPNLAALQGEAMSNTRVGMRKARELKELRHAAAYLIQQVEKRTASGDEE